MVETSGRAVLGHEGAIMRMRLGRSHMGLLPWFRIPYKYNRACVQRRCGKCVASVCGRACSRLLGFPKLLVRMIDAPAAPGSSSLSSYANGTRPAAIMTSVYLE
jgi:hypothetical protein